MEQSAIYKYKRISNKFSRTLIDKETGEEFEVEVISKKQHDLLGIRNSYLIDFFNILGVVDNKKLEVILYVIEHTNKENELFIGTFRSISSNSGASLSTVKRVMKTLMDNNIIKKVQNGVYSVDTSYLDISKSERYMLINYQIDNYSMKVSEINE